ncbi:hypothetical protein LAZ67_1000895 [Cordylochernes scorpioides]|uniref:Uncharacterized protein n=1 Tax=Cordylochernes scorpioides TaxID=51811 RepID=A0ABY6JV56_9ARAC|nr:hypothetical protein LAZ67_1000895 [Cordylochernes scorpioides]
MKYDRRTHLEEFQIDDLVWCKNFRGGDKWIPEKIVGKKGTRVYTILIHGQVKAYHRDQIRKRWRNGEEDESGDGERQPEHSRGAGPKVGQDSEVQSDTDDGKSLEPLRSLDPEALKEEGPVLRRNPPRARRPPAMIIMVICLPLMISGIEPNPGPKKQTTLLTEPTPTVKESADTELKTMIVQMSSEIRNLGERIDTRLSNIEKRMIEWDQRLLGVEMKLTTYVETLAATNEIVSENVTKLREIEARTDFLEMKLREPNLVFYGVEGEANEGPAESLQKYQQPMPDDEIIDIRQVKDVHVVQAMIIMQFDFALTNARAPFDVGDREIDFTESEDEEEPSTKKKGQFPT